MRKFEKENIIKKIGRKGQKCIIKTNKTQGKRGKTVDKENETHFWGSYCEIAFTRSEKQQ